MDKNIEEEVFMEMINLPAKDARRKAITMPAPDQHLLKFSNTSHKAACVEYRAQNDCTLVEADAVIKFYRENDASQRQIGLYQIGKTT